MAEQSAGSGSGTEIGYRVEVRSSTAFVAWDIKGYECMATPRAEFVIGDKWQVMPLASVPAPFGIAPADLRGHFTPSAQLVSYQTARAVQAALLARFKHSPGFETRISEVTYKYQFTATQRSEAPISAFPSARFQPCDDTALSAARGEEG